MLLALLASAVAVAAQAAAPAAPSPSPLAAATDAAAKPPTIESLLQGGSPGQSTDTDEEPGAAATSGPVPYGELDGKAYDRALKGAAAAARAQAGPLDGGWTLADEDGRNIYRFQFVDRGAGMGLAEGAWRDLRGGLRLKGSGFVSQVAYEGQQLTLRFYETDASDEVVVAVKPSGEGAWTGELRRHGDATPITFRKD